MDVRIARIFNTYGPRMAENDGRVVSNFVVQALRGTPLTIYGTGSQTRSFCYVDDLVAGLMRLMALEGDVAHEPVNLGNPGEFSMRELAEMVATAMGAGQGGLGRGGRRQDPPQPGPQCGGAAWACFPECRWWTGWRERSATSGSVSPARPAGSVSRCLQEGSRTRGTTSSSTTGRSASESNRSRLGDRTHDFR